PTLFRSQVAGNDGQVAVVHTGAVIENADAVAGVVRSQQHRGAADALRPEARADPERAASIERYTDDGKIHTFEVRHVREPHKRAHTRKTRQDHTIDWPVVVVLHCHSSLSLGWCKIFIPG